MQQDYDTHLKWRYSKVKFLLDPASVPFQIRDHRPGDDHSKSCPSVFGRATRLETQARNVAVIGAVGPTKLVIIIRWARWARWAKQRALEKILFLMKPGVRR